MQRSTAQHRFRVACNGGKRGTQGRDTQQRHKTLTHHTAVNLAGSKRSDDERDIQVGVVSPALVATLQTAYVVLQLSLV